MKGAPLSTYRRGFECAKRRPEDLSRESGERYGERKTSIKVTRVWEPEGKGQESEAEDEKNGATKPKQTNWKGQRVRRAAAVLYNEVSDKVG